MEQNWVYFLKFNDDLPEYYFTLAQTFTAVGLKLLPVSLADITKFADGSSKMHILCLTKNSNDYQNFIKSLKPQLLHMIRSNLVTFYHLSSYNKLNLGHNSTKLTNYHFTILPVNMQLLASAVLTYMQRESENANRWPGGKRGAHQVAQL
jgi:hypothetical protein